jgi:hypothetical protein
VVAVVLLLGFFDDVWSFWFGSGCAFISFGSAWETFLAFSVVSDSSGVRSH